MNRIGGLCMSGNGWSSQVLNVLEAYCGNPIAIVVTVDSWLQ
jgi:hypothetical protein